MNVRLYQRSQRAQPLTNIPQKQAQASDTKQRENQQTRQGASCIRTRKSSLQKKGSLHNLKRRKKAVCIIGGESEALGFHQETMEESRKQQDWFCIKLYIISYQITCILVV